MLKFNKTQIEKLPKEIGQLINLAYLDLTRNNIKELPKEIKNLFQLEELLITKMDVSDKQLIKFPDFISRFKKLKILDMYNNKLKSVSSHLLNLPKIEDIILNSYLISS
ncbi:hypothetical protein BCR36DRAFT_272095 [Piromyces finnis]|uniref:Disease resistance R13L4/SHOC-2-like LRR domain-containing protein n=1 Tax=Piromyces finnis TaxID=1754191 RepID=A0A1Y1VPB8_9FUNG|nr:hypothetical protein BCR36DRAFT_272095 [Piromyces finnis]|eukprot:ORX61268.1 hypothetical protein BCR36DRAFT_272095 [Piromyces finnis]